MQRLMILVIASLLTACSARPNALPPVKPPANAASKCPALRAPTIGEHYEAYTAYVVDEYYICAIRHDSLADWATGKSQTGN